MTSFMKSNPKLHLYGWLWASDLLPMTSSVKEACSLNEVMIRINVRMCLILTTKMMKMTKMMMVNMGSVCGDYREHQVTSYALSANDRAPMNRRKKSRQTDSFGIDRKRASKLRQTDILCIDRKKICHRQRDRYSYISSFFMKFCFGMNTTANMDLRWSLVPFKFLFWYKSALRRCWPLQWWWLMYNWGESLAGEPSQFNAGIITGLSGPMIFTFEICKDYKS